MKADDILKDSSGYKYKFPARSCSKCKKYSCFKGQSLINFDFAKYGCVEYSE